MIEIQLDIFMCILLGIVLLHSMYKLNMKNTVDKLFNIILLTTLTIIILEIMSVVINSGNNTKFIGIHKTVNMLGFGLTPVIPALLCVIVYNWVKLPKEIKKGEKILFLVPIILNTILTILSWRRGYIFNINYENIYRRGPMFFVCPLVGYTYLFIYSVFLFKNRKRFYGEELLMFSLMWILPSVLGIIQIKYEIFLTIWNSSAIMVIIGYMCILNRKLKTDELTGLENRVAFNEYIKELSKKNKITLSAISIDLDGFKQVNDTYGHSKGDLVLKKFALLLKEVFLDKGKIVRMGGDEFLILIEEKNTIAIKRYIKTLQKKVLEYNYENSCYSIKFSYGVTTFDSKYKDLDEMLSMADELMYKNKKSHNKNN